MTEQHNSITFTQLFEQYVFVEIPIIQRDYAQGRDSAEDIRHGLLESLVNAYRMRIHDAHSKPLNFDFIYGYTRNEVSHQNGTQQSQLVFYPIDGQQRLTTFFLLHWYTAWRGGQTQEFERLFVHNNRAKLKYSVRPSTSDFLDKLICNFPDATVTESTSLKLYLSDQPWFFLSWKNDPSVHSALNMLEAIHQRMYSFDDLYNMLLDSSTPLISFQLLNLDEFGLSDELYIKMNARGKPLTPFEQTKAKIEQYLSFNKSHTYAHNQSSYELFRTNIESRWADLLWAFRDTTTNTFDGQFMNLLRYIMLVTLSSSTDGIEGIVQQLRDTKHEFSVQQLINMKLLSLTNIDFMISTLEHWLFALNEENTAYTPRKTTYFNERELIESIFRSVDTLSYEQIVVFSAYTSFLYHHKGEAISSEKLSDWMRVICNLARNTIYNRPDDYLRGLKFIDEIVVHADNILDYIQHLTRTELAPGIFVWQAGIQTLNGWFYEQQIREEVLKAQLILHSDAWRNVILRAESHSYFRGQIEFLFYFSGLLSLWIQRTEQQFDSDKKKHLLNVLEKDGSSYLRKFIEYFEKICMIIPMNSAGVREFPGALWERALLTYGDYLQSQGQNKHFLKNSDRTFDWKRLLRGGTGTNNQQRDIVRNVLDCIDTDADIEKNLASIIKSAKARDDIDPWREMLIDEPKCIQYCSSRLMRFVQDKPIFLLKGMRVSGEHAELSTFYMYFHKVIKLLDKAELAPFTQGRYCFANDAQTSPGFELISGTGNLKLFVSAHREVLGSVSIKLTFPNMHESIRDVMKQLGFKLHEQTGSATLDIAHTKILTTTKTVCSQLHDVIV